MKIIAKQTIVRSTPTGMFILNLDESGDCDDTLAAQLIESGAAKAADVFDIEAAGTGEAVQLTPVAGSTPPAGPVKNKGRRKPGPKAKADKPAAAPAPEKPAEAGADKLDAPAA